MDCFQLVVQILIFGVALTAGQGNVFYVGDKRLEFIDGRWVEKKMNENEHINSAAIPSPFNKVNIKVFYESLCPGSINFITKQLRPTVERLGPYLNIHLVPYGHATTKEMYGDFLFECQHGPLECYGNKIHACAIDVLRNETESALFNACLMEYTNYRRDAGFDYSIVVNWCNYKLKIQTQGIWACINGERGSILLKNYGEETRAVGLPFIPYILINESTEKQDEATRDLKSVVCHMLQPMPIACYS